MTIMLFLLLLSAHVSGQSLDPTTFKSQGFKEEHYIHDTVQEGTNHLYGVNLMDPTFEYFTITLNSTIGDADLFVSTKVNTKVVTWLSKTEGIDIVHILRTDVKLKDDGKGLQREFEVVVIGYSTAQYSLTLTVGSGTAALATLKPTYEKITAFSTLMEEFETRESEGLGVLQVSLVTLLGVGAATGIWALYRRRKTIHEGCSHLVAL